MAYRLCRSVCVAFGFILAGIGLLLGFYVFPKVIHDKIDDSVKLVKGSDAFKRWEILPLPLQFKVYFFNVTNPDEVQHGAKPIVKEIGPYVYNQYRHKYDIVEKNDTLFYYQNQTYFFNAEASKPNKEDDIITVAHLPLMTVITMAEQMASRVIKYLNDLVGTLFYEPKNLFLTTTPRKFLFDGIFIACDKKNDIKISTACGIIKKENVPQLEKLEDGRLKFSLLSFKNNTNDGRYQVNSGVKYIDRLGQILSWKNSSDLSMWNGTCKSLYGTDTTIFPPHRTQFSKINVFQSDICRSVHLHYNSEVVYKDIEGLRYIVGSDMLASPANFSANQCFCLNRTRGIKGKDDCLLDGAMELWECQRVPIILTFPHFYLGHEVYKNSVDGLTPDRSLHEVFVDIEPKSGTILRGSKRVQFNIFYRKVKGMNITQELSDSLMPVVWIDEGVELNNENIQLLNDSLFYPMKILDGVYWTLIGLGLAIGIIALLTCMLFADKPKNLF